MVVIIAPESSNASQIFERMLAWSASGVIDDFCWASVEQSEEHLAVKVVSKGNLEIKTLGRALAHLELKDDRVRFLALQPARDDGADLASDFVPKVTGFMNLAAEIFPENLADPIGAELVLVPPGLKYPLPEQLFAASWRSIVLVSPEDRESPDHGNLLAEEPGLYVSHAAHALIVLAGLTGETAGWISRERSAPDGGFIAPVVVARNYSRTLDLGYMADHLAERVFTPTDGWVNPDHEKFERVEDPAQKLAGACSTYIADHPGVFNIRHFKPRSLEPLRPLRLGEALREFVDLFFAIIRSLPTMVVQFIFGRAHDFVAVRLEKGFAKLGDPRLVERYADRFAKTNQVLDALDAPRTVVDDVDGAVGPAWRAFQRFHCGIIDGSPMPSDALEVVLKRDRYRLIETDPSRVVPNPANVPPSPADGVKPRACDPMSLVPGYRQLLGLAESDVAEEAVPAAAAAAVTTDSVAEGAVVDNPAAENPAAQSQITDSPLVNTVDEATAKYLDDWVDPHRQTPAWKVGEHIVQAIATADAEGLDEPEIEELAQAEEKVRKEEAETLKKNTAKLVGFASRKARMRSIILAILYGASIYGLGGQRSILTIALLSMFFVFIWLVMITMCVRWYFKRTKILVHAQAGRFVEYENRINLGRTRAADDVRLRRRYTEYLDWAEIVGWMAHRPWSPAAKHVEDRPAVDLDDLPASALLAGSDSSEALTKVARRVGHELFSERWLTGHYSAIEKQEMRRWADERGLRNEGASDEILPDPTIPSQDRESPARILTANLRDASAVALTAAEDERSSNLASKFLVLINDMTIDHLTGAISTRNNPDPAFAPVAPIEQPSDHHADQENTLDAGASDVASNLTDVTSRESKSAQPTHRVINWASASDYLDGLYASGTDRSMLSDTWNDYQVGDSVVADTFPKPTPDFAKAPIDALSSGFVIGQPLRVVATLTEVTRRVDASRLASFVELESTAVQPAEPPAAGGIDERKGLGGL